MRITHIITDDIRNKQLVWCGYLQWMSEHRTGNPKAEKGLVDQEEAGEDIEERNKGEKTGRVSME